MLGGGGVDVPISSFSVISEYSLGIKGVLLDAIINSSLNNNHTLASCVVIP